MHWREEMEKLVNAKAQRREGDTKMEFDLGKIRQRTREYLERHGVRAPDSGVRAKRIDGGVAEIEIFGEIDEFWGVGPKQVSVALAEAGDAQEIRVKLNSPGGWAFDGVAIYNLLKLHPAKMEITVYGLAASAASIIAMAGDRIIMAEGAMMMIHKSWGIAMGNSDDFVEIAGILEKIDGEMAGIYARRTGQELAQIKQWMESETYFTGAEAVEHGFADEAAAAAKAKARAAEGNVWTQGARMARERQAEQLAAARARMG